VLGGNLRPNYKAKSPPPKAEDKQDQEPAQKNKRG
jgi:hypothetical protein